jgi:hypothetical protein
MVDFNILKVIVWDGFFILLTFIFLKYGVLKWGEIEWLNGKEFI